MNSFDDYGRLFIAQSQFLNLAFLATDACSWGCSEVRVVLICGVVIMTLAMGFRTHLWRAYNLVFSRMATITAPHWTKTVFISICSLCVFLEFTKLWLYPELCLSISSFPSWCQNHIGDTTSSTAQGGGGSFKNRRFAVVSHGCQSKNTDQLTN